MDAAAVRCDVAATQNGRDMNAEWRVCNAESAQCRREADAELTRGRRDANADIYGVKPQRFNDMHGI